MGKVTDMSELFKDLSTFNEDISGWEVGQVTNMSFMFYGTSSFNQNLCAWKDQFPYNNATVIFLDSSCTFQGNPQIEKQGPFCAFDCTDSDR